MSISSDLMYRLLVENVSDYAIYMLDAQGIVLNWNAGAERAKGYTAAEIVGRNYSLFYSEDDRAAAIPARNLETARQNGGLRIEGWRIRKDGSRFWALVTIDPIFDEGRFVGFAKVTRDLTEKHEMIARIEHQATHDPLTGLLNRAGLFGRLGRALREGEGVAIHCIDLDGFKPINDRHGHMAGDDALRLVADRMENAVTGTGFTARVGGDEFIAVQSDVTRRNQSSAFAQKLENAIGRPMSIGSDVLQVGASIGSAVAPLDGTEIGALLLHADRALYATKKRRMAEAASAD